MQATIQKPSILFRKHLPMPKQGMIGSISNVFLKPLKPLINKKMVMNL
jgi:hypothetical protein